MSTPVDRLLRETEEARLHRFVEACINVRVSGGADLLGGGDEQSRLRAVTDELIRRFDRSIRPIPPDEVEAQMNEAVNAYADARIRDFVPILAEKDARAVLRHRVVTAE